MKKLEKFTCKYEWAAHHKELKDIQEFDNCFIASDGYRIGIVKKEVPDNNIINTSKIFNKMIEACERFSDVNDLKITVNRKDLLNKLNEQFKETKQTLKVSRKSQCLVIINIHSDNSYDTQIVAQNTTSRSYNNNYSIAFNLQYFIDAIDLFTPDREKELELRFDSYSSISPMAINTDKRSAALFPVKLPY